MAREVPSTEEVAAALQTLARLVAPYVRDLLLDETPVQPRGAEARDWDEQAAGAFVEKLPHELLVNGGVLFAALREPPHEVDTGRLADFTGLLPRELSGRLLRPLGQRATKEMGLPEPWTSVRVAPRGEYGARTLLRADGDTAGLLSAAFEEASRSSGKGVSGRQRTDVPRPSAVFVYRPEFAEGLQEKQGWSSCLRDSAPGTRAVIYQALADQGLVAIFDVEREPEWDDDFGWMAYGSFTPIARHIRREELLAVKALEPVFLHIQGRRRLPAEAQVALVRLIEDVGQTKLPRHSLTRAVGSRSKGSRARSRRG